MMEFLFAHLWTIIGVVSGLGSIAIIAFLVVAGIPAVAVLAALINAWGKLLEFLKTPAGQAIAGVLAIGLALFIGDAHGHREEMKVTARKVAARDVYWKAKIVTAAAAFGKARQARDESVDDEIGQFVEQQLLEINVQQKAFETVVSKHDIKPSSNSCLLTPADIDDGGVRAQPSGRAAGTATGAGRTRQ